MASPDPRATTAAGPARAHRAGHALARARATHETLDRVLSEEVWRAEVVMHRFRIALWLGLGLVALLVYEREARIPLMPVVSIAWGLACVAVGRLWLRRRECFSQRIAFAITTLDITILGLASDLTVHNGNLTEVEITRNIYSLGFVLMLVIGANILRMSLRLSVWTTLWASAAFATVLMRNAVWTAFNCVDLLYFLGLGAIATYGAFRLKRIMYRVQQRDAFARFLPGPVVERLTADPSAFNLGGDEQVATVLFADVRDFTTLAERHPPAEIVAWLNEYFEVMVDEIFRWNGILDKFLGDGLCAVFGSPTEPEEQAVTAVACARAMLQRLDELNELRKERGDPPLRIGIGINTGHLIAGNIGSSRRLEYTHIGDTVNMASRIEGLTKQLGATILVSDSTYAAGLGLAGMPTQSVAAPVPVKGKAQPVKVWIIGEVKAVSPAA